MTTSTLLTLFPLIILLTVLAVLSKKFGQTSVSHITSSYTAHPTFLSPAERFFFVVLSKATENDYQIFAKVRLSDLINPENTTNRRQWQTAFNRISGKHVDFVLGSAQDLSVKAIIELDNSSHTKSHRKQPDEFVDSALSSAMILILHVQVTHTYSPQQLRTNIQSAINRTATI